MRCCTGNCWTYALEPEGIIVCTAALRTGYTWVWTRYFAPLPWVEVVSPHLFPDWRWKRRRDWKVWGFLVDLLLRCSHAATPTNGVHRVAPCFPACPCKRHGIKNGARHLSAGASDNGFAAKLLHNSLFLWRRILLDFSIGPAAKKHPP